MAKVKAIIPDNISEEYYQISNEIYSSFSKYRPPVDLFQYKEDIKALYPFSRKGERLSNEQIDLANQLCDTGSLFVSRTDHPIYSEHIVKQLDLVLLDHNIKSSEIADIIIRALQWRFTNFWEQPVLPVFELLYKDILVLTEYIWNDKHQLRLFIRRLFTDKADPSKHAVNTLIIGLWLYTNIQTGYTRRTFDRIAIGLLLHDIGMCKIPPFLVQKAGKLKPDELEKIRLHPLVGIKVLQKMDLGFDELNQAIIEHHERIDGSGYPQKSKDLSIIGKLTAISDSFSAMILDVPYRPSKTFKEAVQELVTQKNLYDNAMALKLQVAILTGALELPPVSK